MPDFLAGKKTLIAACLLAFLAFNSAYPVISPELAEIIQRLAEGLGLFGLAMKLERRPGG